MPEHPPPQVASVPQEYGGQPRRVVVGGMSWRETFAALKHRNFRLFFVGQFVSLIGSWIQTSVSHEMRGRVMGIWALIFGGTMPLGGLESGLLAQFIGVPWTVGLGAVICAGAGFVTWLKVRHNENGPVEPGR